ncbi:hypothetical protein HN681_03085 [archaeon]|jgi:hypothetical protein|nr:hypothetical protein [archaeon]MBT3730952.1 hypothetical protein [archaeon]MBT4669810.1 hypothetical protein [archaeon]MBT7053375.1 hypothetical protein [archaeon]MBT8010401.1 hypothetical protein [archaeon]
MKRILLVIMVLSLLVVVGCATEEGTVCFTEEELEEMNTALTEVTGEEDSEIQYAPGATEDRKGIIMNRVRSVNTFFATYEGDLEEIRVHTIRVITREEGSEQLETIEDGVDPDTEESQSESETDSESDDGEEEEEEEEEEDDDEGEEGGTG